MAKTLCSRLLSIFRTSKTHLSPVSSSRSYDIYSSIDAQIYGGFCPHFEVSRSYSRDRGKHYDLFSSVKPGDEKFKKAWKKEMDDDSCLWKGSEDENGSEDDSDNDKSHFVKEIQKVQKQAKEHSDLIDTDDSDELWSVWSGSDEEKTLWTGDEGDEDYDVPTEAYPNGTSDKYIDNLFEFDEKLKYRTISELLKAENEPEELSLVGLPIGITELPKYRTFEVR